jgi:hypothetical protein
MMTDLSVMELGCMFPRAMSEECYLRKHIIPLIPFIQAAPRCTVISSYITGGMA